jgi:Protein of unknown function (DUF2905)
MGLGRLLITAGGVLVVLGVLVTYGRRLPGDIYYQGRHGTFYFPVVTCLLLSAIVSAIMWLLNRR